ncbi:hypothetical protein EB796_006873 [Bugula neritina]|uniref:Uncharacterized protein n=1 Tax=Bugula neritina TaxID=10212 RepID=A0A7J7K859_BUGNE|nr:hypothetical protein EB796_006873 [Bugula neritina]
MACVSSLTGSCFLYPSANVSAIRSPSKKKSASRQRSVPEAAVSASAVAPEENADVVENEGALLNKGKPDIIPDPPTVSVRGAESRLSSDSSSTLDPTQSSSEGAAVTFTASHQGAAKVSMYSGKGKESTTATTSSSYVSCSSSIYVGPPLDDGAPPPYSETAPLMTPAAENGQAGDGESVFKKQPVQPFPNMFGHQSAGRDHTSCSSEEESEENLYVPTLLFARAQCLVDTVSPCDWLIQSLQLFPETHRSLGLVAAGPSISSDIPPAIETEQTFL